MVNNNATYINCKLQNLKHPCSACPTRCWCSFSSAQDKARCRQATPRSQHHRQHKRPTIDRVRHQDSTVHLKYHIFGDHWRGDKANASQTSSILVDIRTDLNVRDIDGMRRRTQKYHVESALREAESSCH